MKLTKQEEKFFLYAALLLGTVYSVVSVVQGQWLMAVVIVLMMALLSLTWLQRERSGKEPKPTHPIFQVLLWGYLVFAAISQAADGHPLTLYVLLATVAAYGVILLLRRRKPINQ